LKNTRSSRLPAALPALSAGARKLWRDLVGEYQLEDSAGTSILRAGLEAFDRMRGAQRAIAKDGLTVRDRWGQVKVHPCTTVERDSRAQFLAALRQLNLDLEPLRDRIGRPGGS